MSFLRLVVAFFLCLIVFGANAQKLNMKWSDKIELHNSKDGFFSYFLGENDKYLYAYFKKKGKSERYKIVAFDKKTMKRKYATEVIGYDSNKKEARKFKGLEYYRTVIYDNVIYAFFKSNDNKSNKILVKSYSAELKLQKPLTLVTSQPEKKQRKNKEAYPFILANSEVGKVFIGVEKEASPQTNVKLEYKVLNNDFTFSNANQIELPVIYKGGTWLGGGKDGLSSSYEYGDDGKVHLRSTISAEKDEIKELKKNKNKSKFLNSISYTVLSTINLKTGEYKSLPLKAENKRLFSIYKMITKDNTRLYGYFSDYEKDKRGYATHGIFYAVLNKDYEVENMTFSHFDKKLIKEMFKNDKDDKDGGRKAGCCLIGKKGSTHADDETMNSDYVIEQAIEGEDGSVYLFTSKMNNYSVTSCSTDANGNQTCTTRYYCEKGNVTSFKVNKEGGIEWGTNYDRKKTYSGWYIYDLNVIEDDNGFYATYGTYNNKRAHKAWWKVWKTVDYTNPMEYVYIKRKDGKVKKEILPVNKPNTPKKEAKYIEATSITVIDNKYYVNDSREFVNPAGYPVYCLGGCLMPDMMGSFYKGYGFFGVLEPASK